MWTRFAGALLFALLFGVQVKPQTSEPQFVIVSDVQFCTGGGRPLLMDIFIPNHRNRDPTPAVLWIHGGGWDHGHSNAAFFANEGFVSGNRGSEPRTRGTRGLANVSSKVQAAAS